jgi:uncharacterized membrane protein YgcG
MEFLHPFRPPFLTDAERAQLQDGLAHACRHAGEPIGLIVDAQASGEPDARAVSLFESWDIATEARPRAVLVYANAATRRFAVIGGAEIRRVAPQAFWTQVRTDLQHHFDDERYCDGLFKAVAQIAIQLHFHFHPTLPEDAPPRISPPDSKSPL